jgi:hypothetical protein
LSETLENVKSCLSFLKKSWWLRGEKAENRRICANRPPEIVKAPSYGLRITAGAGCARYSTARSFCGIAENGYCVQSRKGAVTPDRTPDAE